MYKNIGVFALIILLGVALYLGINSLLPKPIYPATAWGENKEGEWQEVKMQYFVDWDTLKKIVTPNLDFPEITDGYIPFPNPKNPDGFRCAVENKTARLDMDGDGTAEKELTANQNMVQYDLTYKDGSKSKYQLRVWQNGTKEENDKKVPKWSYQRAGFMKGNIGGEDIILIDDNNNGRYNDYTQDAICIGTGNKFAGLFSRFIVIRDKLYEFKINESGLKVLVKEYKGPMGKINLVKGLDFPKHLPIVVSLQSAETTPSEQPSQNERNEEEPDEIPADQVDKLSPKKPTPKPQSTTHKIPDASLTVYPKDKAISIPVGEYDVIMALFSKQTRMRKGSLKPIKVEENKEIVLKWGGPFKICLEPTCESGGQIYTFIPPGMFAPPQLLEQKLDCLFIKMDLPTSFAGINGEEYFSPPEFADPAGNCLPDALIDSFDMNITAKEPAAGNKTPKGKQLNTGSTFAARWTKWDPSGLVDHKPKEWVDPYYQCPMYDYLGTVSITVSTQTSIFGKVTFEGTVEVKK